MNRGKHYSTFLGIIILVIVCNVTQAQNWPFELWHEGRLVLLEGDTLKGMIKYDLQQDLVQYTLKDKKADVYTARKVLFFEIFDATVSKYRQFYALPFANTTGYKAPIFFELLEEGRMTLLAREHLEYKTYSSPYYIGSYSKLVLTYKYFFLQEDGSISEFVGNKNDLLEMMERKAEEVEKYMKDNRLKFDNKYDLAKIVAYYNSLYGT